MHPTSILIVTGLWTFMIGYLWHLRLPEVKLVQKNEYETDQYFLQNVQCMILLILEFCKICEHEIVLQEGKSKQK